MRIRELRLRVICHATEDEEKVRHAVGNVLSPGLADSFNISRQSLSGHYGDPLILYRFESKSGTQATKAVQAVLGAMTPQDKAAALESWKSGIGSKVWRKDRIYLRFDKQMAYGRILKDGEFDSIRIEVRLSGVNKGDIEDLLLEGGSHA